MEEEILINVGIGGDDVSKLSQDFDKLGKDINGTSKQFDSISKGLSNIKQNSKTAFDIVSSTLNMASTDAKMLQKNLLEIRFPKIGDATDKEMRIVYNSFIQAEKLGTSMFDMASLASKIFKDDMYQVNLAVAQYNELFEKNTGVDGITLNTSALLALRNQVVSTGGSVSNLNKEINSMTTSSKELTTFSGLMANINNYVKDGILDIERFSEALMIAKSNGITYAASFSEGLEVLEDNLIDINSEIAYLNSLSAEDRASYIDNEGRAYEEVLKSQIKLKIETEDQITTLENYKTSIQGLKDEVVRLTTEYSKLSAEERAGIGGSEIIGQIRETTNQIKNAEVEINKLGVTARGSKAKGFDPLGNSIMQVTREFPNFFISTQIGIMALSNNLPILGDAIQNFREMQKAAKEAGEVVPSMLSTIKKSIFSLGGAFTLISVASMILPKIIEWITKIPETVEIKIKFNEDIIKATENQRILVQKIQHDLDTIGKRTDANATAQLKAIKEVMVQNKIATKDEIDNLSAKELANSKYFERYLKQVALVAKQEAIIKKQIEAQVAGEVAMSKATSLFNQYATTGKYGQKVIKRGGLEFTAKQLIKMAYDGSLTEEVIEALYVWGVAQDIIDQLRIVATSNTIIKEMNKVQKTMPKLEFLIDSKTTGGGGKGSSFNVSAKSSYKQAVKDLEGFKEEWISQLDKFVSEYEGKNNEMIHMDEIAKKEAAGYGKFLGYTFEATTKQQLKYQEEILEARKIDLENDEIYFKEKLSNLETERNKTIEESKKSLDEKLIAFNKELELNKEKVKSINQLNDDIEKADAVIAKKVEAASKLKSDKSKKAAQTEIDILVSANDKRKKLRDEENGLFTTSNETLQKLLKEKTDLEKQYNEAIAKGADIDTIKEKLDTVSSQILDVNVEITNNIRNQWLDTFDDIKDGIETLGSTFSNLSSMSDSYMTVIDNQTAAEQNKAEIERANFENSSEYARMTDAQREEYAYNEELRNYELEKKAYDNKLKLFEQKKAYDIGVTTVETISGGIAAVTQGVKEFGPIAGAIIGGIEAAAIAASGIAAIQEIKSQKLDAPIPPVKSSSSSSSSSSATTANVALNPVATAMTSKEENLNMMSQGGKSDDRYSVKVSEINNVQKKVSVRENNSTY